MISANKNLYYMSVIPTSSITQISNHCSIVMSMTGIPFILKSITLYHKIFSFLQQSNCSEWDSPWGSW